MLQKYALIFFWASGRAFHYNLLPAAERSRQKGFPLQSLTQASDSASSAIFSLRLCGYRTIVFALDYLLKNYPSRSKIFWHRCQPFYSGNSGIRPLPGHPWHRGIWIRI